jgi:hypothetical protein
MNRKLAIFSAALTFMSVAAMGCMADAGADAPEMNADVPLETMDGPSGNNGLMPLCFWAPQNLQDLFYLAKVPLLDANGQIITLPPLTTSCGAVYEDLFKCAMPYGWSGVAPDGTTYNGLYGVAKQWAKQPLDVAGRRWVTACMLQHLNGMVTPVPIMLEGNNAGLAPIPGQNTSALTFKDATMFGNIFLGPSDSHAFACWEQTVGDCVGETMVMELNKRMCDMSQACHLTPLGSCKGAGTLDANGFWTFPQYGYTETIRSSINPKDAGVLYPACY